MNLNLNLSNEYVVRESTDEIFSRLDAIISAPFNDSKFATYGNFTSADPPEFILVNKGLSFIKPIYSSEMYTRLVVTFSKDETKSKIQVETKTSPGIFILLFFGILATIVCLFSNPKWVVFYLIFSIAVLIFDRFSKNILLNCFERDLKLSS